MTYTYTHVGEHIIVPTNPAGQFTMHVEDDIATIERRYYGHHDGIKWAPDHVTTFQIPVNALRALLA